MIETALKLLEKLLEMLAIRERNAEKYFTNFVEPMFAQAELVAKDYIELFRELIEKLEHERNIPNVIVWIEDRRGNFLPLRIKLRGTLDRGRSRSDMDRFQDGIWRLLKGGMSFIDEGYVGVEYTEAVFITEDEPRHTVLDLLYKWSQKPSEQRRSKCIEQAKYQLTWIEDAWHDIAAEYARLKEKVYG